MLCSSCGQDFEPFNPDHGTPCSRVLKIYVSELDEDGWQVHRTCTMYQDYEDRSAPHEPVMEHGEFFCEEPDDTCVCVIPREEPPVDRSIWCPPWMAD